MTSGNLNNNNNDMECIYENGSVQMPRDAYDSLCELKRENENLRNEIARLAKKKTQRVIEVIRYGISLPSLPPISYDFKNFDDVKEQVEKHYGNTIEELKKTNEKLLKEKSKLQNENNENANAIEVLDADVKRLQKDEQELRKEINELKDKNLDLEMQISKLKRRNLWQRIWNK